MSKDDELSPAGFRGGQGRTARDVEDDASACAIAFVVGVVVLLAIGLSMLLR